MAVEIRPKGCAFWLVGHPLIINHLQTFFKILTKSGEGCIKGATAK